MSYQALLFCPDEKTARVVTQVLTELDFTVETASEPFAAVKKLMAQHFDAIVVDCENEQNATLLFKSARNSSSNQSSLAVAVVEGQAGVAKAFRIGANLVLTKPINVEQSKGTLRVARGLLRKGTEAGKPAPAGDKPEASAPPTATRPAAPASIASKPPLPPTQARSTFVFAPKAEPVTMAPAASIAPGGFEKEPEATPEPDAGDSAMLESMHESPLAPPQPAATSKPSLAFATPLASVNSSNVAATSPEVPDSGASASESASQKPMVAKPAIVKPAPQSVATPIASGHGGQGAAAAPARSKEAPSVKWLEPELDVPRIEEKPEAAKSAPKPAMAVMSSTAFSTLDSKDSAEHSAGSKTPFIVVAAILVLCVGGYFGWNAMRSKAGQSKPAPVQASMPSSSAQLTSEAPMQADATVTAPAPFSQQPAASKPSASSIAKPVAPAAKPEPHEIIAEDKTVTVAESQPMTVRKDPVRPSSSANSQPEDQALAPAPLGIGSSSPDKALASVTNAPVAVPRAAPHMVNISQGISTGLLLKRVQPVYPAQALSMRIDGDVELQATITKEGSISNLKVVSGPQLLARAAVDAVRQWKYKPYFLDGQPVEVQTQITVRFKLPN
ncbi:MAG TPA: TonB family protein [Terriglobales bacterium]|nr:TonB family protein [Terriglobales bacterium]